MTDATALQSNAELAKRVEATEAKYQEVYFLWIDARGKYETAELRIADLTRERDEARANNSAQTSDAIGAAVTRAEVAERERDVARAAADAEMERVKACDHIACGDEGWETLRHICVSTMTVASLRDRAEAAERRNAGLARRVEEIRKLSLASFSTGADQSHRLSEAIKNLNHIADLSYRALTQEPPTS